MPWAVACTSWRMIRPLRLSQSNWLVQFVRNFRNLLVRNYSVSVNDECGVEVCVI
jgi:hypothetical protein